MGLPQRDFGKLGKVSQGGDLRKDHRGFPGGSVVKNMPASAGDKSLTPDPGRLHMQLSLCTTAIEPVLSSQQLQLLKPEHPRACALQHKKSPQQEACAVYLERSPPPLLQLEKALTARKTRHSQN